MNNREMKNESYFAAQQINELKRIISPYFMRIFIFQFSILNLITIFARSKNYFNIKNLRIMYLDSAKKKEIFEKYGKSNTDTGSPEAQIALFSYRISHLTEHLKLNRKDYSTERSLTMLVGKRRRLLNYLKDRDIEKYRAIVKELGLRK
jgi:small subunit ribosomal protein S15